MCEVKYISKKKKYIIKYRRAVKIQIKYGKTN